VGSKSGSSVISGPGIASSEENLTDLFLMVLVAAWIVALWPAAVRAKRSTPLFTAERWRRRMESIAPRAGRSGRWVMAPQSSGARDRSARRALKALQRRCKRLLIVLAALVPVSLVPALLRGGPLWVLHAASYAVLAVYVALLVETRRRRAEAQSNVRSLAGRRRAAARAPQAYEERRA
jgi:hypothetical protein